MALVFNNVTVPQSGNVIYNGTSLSVVKHGNTQVWKRAPEYLYNNGDQCSGFTGGWDARAAYFLNTDTYYRNQTGTKPVFNTGNISVTCTGSYLGGGSVDVYKRQAPRCRGDDYESPTAYFLSIKKVGKER